MNQIGKISIIIGLMFSSACHSENANNASNGNNQSIVDSANRHPNPTKVKKDTIKKEESITKSVDIKTDSVNALVGLWILKGTDNPAFEIRKSTIYYPEHFKSYKYQIKGDSIKISYDGYVQSFSYDLKIKDTLKLSNQDYGETVYFRKK
ncbi:hypothetical protein [Mucilaginibacter sp.]